MSIEFNISKYQCYLKMRIDSHTGTKVKKEAIQNRFRVKANPSFLIKKLQLDYVPMRLLYNA